MTINQFLTTISQLHFERISDHEEMATFCGSRPLFCVLVDGKDPYFCDPMEFYTKADAEYQVKAMIEAGDFEAERITIEKV